MLPPCQHVKISFRRISRHVAYGVCVQSAPRVLSFTSIYYCSAESFQKCDLFIIGVLVSLVTEHWLRCLEKFAELQQCAFVMCVVSFQVFVALCQLCVKYPAAQLQALQITLTLQKMICFKKRMKFMNNSSSNLSICVRSLHREL